MAASRSCSRSRTSSVSSWFFLVSSSILFLRRSWFRLAFISLTLSRPSSSATLRFSSSISWRSLENQNIYAYTATWKYFLLGKASVARWYRSQVFFSFLSFLVSSWRKCWIRSISSRFVFSKLVFCVSREGTLCTNIPCPAETASNLSHDLPAAF